MDGHRDRHAADRRAHGPDAGGRPRVSGPRRGHHVANARRCFAPTSSRSPCPAHRGSTSNGVRSCSCPRPIGSAGGTPSRSCMPDWRPPRSRSSSSHAVGGVSSARAAALLSVAGFWVARQNLAMRPQLIGVVLFSVTLWILAGGAPTRERCGSCRRSCSCGSTCTAASCWRRCCWASRGWRTAGMRRPWRARRGRRRSVLARHVGEPVRPARVVVCGRDRDQLDHRANGDRVGASDDPRVQRRGVLRVRVDRRRIPHPTPRARDVAAVVLARGLLRAGAPRAAGGRVVGAGVPGGDRRPPGAQADVDSERGSRS